MRSSIEITVFALLVVVLFINISSITSGSEKQITSLHENPVSDQFNLTQEGHAFLTSDSVTSQQQFGAKLPNPDEPLRELKFGKINFLHTTDTHGWYLGHLNQKPYSADFGDFHSFHANLLDSLNRQGKDLLLIDTGDRHDGNGLSDLTSPNGLLSNNVFKSIDYDLVTIGNHELYKEDVSRFEYENLVPHYGEKFISTNVKYLNDDNEWVIFGNNTHRYFKSPINGYDILSFSFLFDFKLGNSRVDVTPVTEIIEQEWFVQLLTTYSTDLNVDLIVIFGHIPVSHQWLELYELHNVFRSFFPSTVIQYFGGHSHIRDFTILDDHSTGLQSGRYCETVGFLSIQELSTEKADRKSYIEQNINRRYIDFNIHSFMHHSNSTTLDEFNTEKGLTISSELSTSSELLSLDETYGHVPQNYLISAADYLNNDPKSLLRFLERDILVQLEPMSCTSDLEVVDTSNDKIILINTGGIRYDLYKGNFNKNSLFTVSPFKNKWKVIYDIPTEKALRLLQVLNDGDFIINNQRLVSSYQSKMNELSLIQQEDTSINNQKLTYGHTTVDDFGTDGDDTIHRNIPSFYVPNVIQSHQLGTNHNLTDVIYYDFIEPFILSALGQIYLDDSVVFNASSSFYNDCSEDYNLGQLLKKYAIDNWS